MMIINSFRSSGDFANVFRDGLKSAWDRQCVRIAALLLTVLALGPVSAFAQINTASILGNVVDAQGAAVARATVTAQNLGTGATRTATTDSAGGYVIPLLPAGSYRVTATMKGFRSAVVSSATLAAGDSLRQDLHLQLGEVSQTVEVTAQPPALQSQDASLGALITPRATEDLPLNGRNFQGLTLLVPGASNGLPGGLTTGARPDDRRNTSSVSINDNPPESNNFLLDGVDDNERFIGTVIVKPSIDSLSEVRIITSNYSANLGRTAGGVINLVSKSGTDQLHGSAYEFLRNDRLDARNFFDKTIPQFRQNQFGGSLGGPIQKGHTFFFGDYEGTRVTQGLTYVSTVPTAAERTGNFAGVNPVFDPRTSTPDPNSRGGVDFTRFANDQLTNMDPIALKLIALYPLPNLSGLVNNYVSNPLRTQTSNNFDARVDHSFKNDTFFARYSFNNTVTVVPSALPEVDGVNPGGNAFGFFGTSPERAQNLLLSDVRVLSPTAILQLDASYTRFHIRTQPPNYGKAVSTQFGIPGANTDINTSGLTNINISGYSGLGDSEYIPLSTNDNNYEFIASLNLIHGSHNIHVGARYERRQLNPFQSATPRGAYSFGASFTSDPTGATPGSGNGLATFLLGLPTSTGRSVYLVNPGLRLNEFGTWIEDDWRVTNTLTLNLGLRWDVYPFISEAFDRISNFDPATGTINIAGQGGVDSHAGVRTNWRNISPRIGFAQMLGDKTVLRGGYGISYVPPYIGSNLAMRNPPFVASYAVTPQTYVPENTIADGFPAPTAISATNPSGGVTAVATHFPTEAVQQYNLNLQRQQFGFVWGIGWVGEQDHHAMRSINLDQAIPGPGPLAPRRPFYRVVPNVSNISYQTTNGNGNYNALQLTVSHRWGQGLSMLGNYTWSHGINNFTDVGGGQPTGEASPQDPTNLRAEIGNSDLDIRQRLILQANYELPFGRNLTGVAGALAKGWQANGIFNVQGGLPFTVTNLTSLTNTGSGSRPNQIGDPVPADQTIHNWINPAAFTAPAQYTFGGVGRNTLRAPGLVNMDFSLFKHFSLGERTTLELRGEAFNLFNHADFSAPNASLGSGAFGTISSTSNPSREVQLAVKLLF